MPAEKVRTGRLTTTHHEKGAITGTGGGENKAASTADGRRASFPESQPGDAPGELAQDRRAGADRRGVMGRAAGPSVSGRSQSPAADTGS